MVIIGHAILVVVAGMAIAALTIEVLAAIFPSLFSD